MVVLNVLCRTVARWASTGRLPATDGRRGRRYDVGRFLEARVMAERTEERKRQTGPPAGWVVLADVAADLRISRSHLRMGRG